jgi:glycosyltransferase involved in cell wall biosynthesis
VSDAAAQPRVGVVGPLPPPSGGMANQCEQLVRLLNAEGTSVQLVCTNAPYRPALAGRVPVLRAGVRLLPYLLRLWRTAGRVDVLHVFANSGWAWHLCVLPALLIARLRGVRVIVNYRGGNADTFFATAPAHVLKMLSGATLRVTPSAYLLRVFRKHGLDAEVIPNIVDLSRFRPAAFRDPLDEPHLIVTRNLEKIYDIPTAIRAFRRVRDSYPTARMTIAGSGPELAALQAVVDGFGLSKQVRFAGRIDNAEMAALYASADCMLNPSTVDNMPISVLEAFASGVPVVSTDAGGIPDLVEDGVSGLLVPVGDDAAMARGVVDLLRRRERAQALRQAGLREAQRYAWPEVSRLWLDAYRRVASARSGAA